MQPISATALGTLLEISLAIFSNLLIPPSLVTPDSINPRYDLSIREHSYTQHAA